MHLQQLKGIQKQKKTKEKQKLPGIKYAFVTFNKQALEDIVF